MTKPKHPTNLKKWKLFWFESWLLQHTNVNILKIYKCEYFIESIPEQLRLHDPSSQTVLAEPQFWKINIFLTQKYIIYKRFKTITV
jgi:hypothetical protein